jgi:hypothetical protein
MKLLSHIIIHRKDDNAAIELLQGDLTAIPKEHATDILVISAYPGSYVPASKTLIAALYDKGIFVGEMAKDKEVDLTGQLGCWLSKPLSEEQQKLFNIRRILCFEPGKAVLENETVVGNIFRCINTFAFDSQNNVIAMPVVASGNQKVPLEKILPATLDAAIFWLENGLPLKSIKLVLLNDGQVEESLPKFNEIRWKYEMPQLKKDKEARLTDVVQKVKRKYEIPHLEIEEKARLTDILQKVKRNFRPGKYNIRGGGILLKSDGTSPHTGKSPEELLPPAQAAPASNKIPVQPTGSAYSYDYFISYAHAHSDLITSFVKSMKLKNSNLRIFYDRNSIPPGGLWIRQISDAIQKAGKVLVFLSPDYDKSPVCWDEFQCAKVMEYNRKKQVIQTIYLYNYKDEMPPIMGIYSYVDCREGDMDKLVACIPALLG